MRKVSVLWFQIIVETVRHNTYMMHILVLLLYQKNGQPSTWLFLAWIDVHYTSLLLCFFWFSLFQQSLICFLQCEPKKSPPWGLVAIFPKPLGIFQPNFTCLLYFPIYARLRIFIQLSATLMKLCHIKHDHPVHIMCAKCPPSAKMHSLTFFRNS